jgi:lysophospholipase L1-like esterase
MHKKTTLRSNLITLVVTLLVLYIGAEAFSWWYISRTDATNKELKIYAAHEDRVWTLKPGATAEHGDGDPPPKIIINSHGFRGDEVAMKKPEDTKRIAILGDSFTFGMLTDQAAVFPKLLQDQLSKEYEVLNFGIIGYSTDQQYLQLRDEVIEFDPDIVILMFFAGNDATELRDHEWIFDNNSASLFGELQKVIDPYHFVTEDNQLRRKRASKSLSTPFITLTKERGILLLSKLGLPVKKPRLLWSNFIAEYDPWGDPKINDYFLRTRTMLDLMNVLSIEKNFKFMVSVIPADVQVNLKYLSKYPGAPFGEEQFDDPNTGLRPQIKLRAITRRSSISKIPYLDLLPEFRTLEKDGTRLYFEKDDPHFTKEGHKETARLLKEKLIELGWL